MRPNDFQVCFVVLRKFSIVTTLPVVYLHPGRSTWNLRITHFKKEYHLPAIMFHRFQPLIFQGVFASFWMMIFTLTKRICWYQMRMEKEKHPKNLTPVSSKSHPPANFDSSLARQVIDVSSVPVVAFATPLITLQLRDQVGRDRKI